MSNEKDTIEYALHAYDNFWEYYKRTLDERNHILNSYLVFVGVPISIIGIFINNIKNSISSYRYVIILLLIIIFVLGIIIYSTYIIESLVSQRYLQKIAHITQYLITHFDGKYHNVFKETYELENLFLDNRNSQTQRINKSFIIIIVSTIIIIGLFLLMFDILKWYQIILSIAFSLIVHFIVYFYYNRRIKHN